MAETLRFWIVLREAPDVPGTWIGHCLELDVVSQGDSPAHALSMTIEAIGIVLEGDAESGLDPRRRRAPEEDWEEFGALLGRSTPLPGPNALRAIEGLTDHLEALLACVELGPANAEVEVPVAWAARADRAPSLSV